MFTLGEVFLLVWALGATLAAVYYQHRFKQMVAFAATARRLLVGLVLGTAKMERRDDGAVFTNLDEDGDITDEVRIQAR